MPIVSNPLAERRMIEDFIPATEEFAQEFSDARPMGKNPAQPKRKKIVKPVQQILAKLAESQGFVPRDRERMSPALPGPTGPMSSVDAMTQMRKTKDQADNSLTQSLQRQAIPQQLLQLLGGFAGRMPSRPNTSQMKAPWPPAANAPTRKMTPEVRPEISPAAPKMNFPSSGASIMTTPPKPPRKQHVNTTPPDIKDAAEYLKMKQLEKFITDSGKQSNPMLDMLVRAGRNVVARKSGEKSAPMRAKSMTKKKSTEKRPWNAPFDGPTEDY